MIYDCFQFFNELDILKLRLNVLDPVVDRFVISEATTTFSGIPKPLFYEENKEMFREFEHKIIHVVVDDTPEGYTHDRDTFQKNAVGRGLKDAGDDDIVIFSDLDEIPDPEKVKQIIQNFDDTKIYHFAQRLFYCYLNMEEISGKLLSYAGDFDYVDKKQWIGSKMCRYSLLKEQNLQLGELRFPERKKDGIRVDDGGWHFGYMGGHGQSDVKARVKEKVVSAAHQEYNKAEVLSDVTDRIKDGKDIFGRDSEFIVVEIDDSYPKYLREHLKEYDHLIYKKETEAAKAVRHFKRGIRKTAEFACKCVRRVLRLVKKDSGKK